MSVYDIGSDHAYLPINLISQNRCKSAFATDIKDGPLFIANKNIISYGLENKIFTVKGDGLAVVSPDAHDYCIVVSGMGGLLVKAILISGLEKAYNSRRLILQPMNCCSIVRQMLLLNKLSIEDEELIREGQHIYTVMSASMDSEVCKPSIEDIYIGKKLLEKRDPLLPYFLDKEINKIEKIFTGFSASDASITVKTLQHGEYRGITLFRLAEIKSAMIREKEKAMKG